ncbi:MAG: glycine betaine/L-proline ABC transporter ATP-binding protein [Firmicutes bacterium]|nr:glycine betaine/L-proline ABC transporter ATP-binding protein [Bacillota bacterium]
MSKLVVKGLYKIFGSNPKRGLKLLQEGCSKEQIFRETGLTVGINNANFEVEEGETFVIMGLSGSGKSTVVRCLNRLVEPTAGEILLDGRNILEMDRKELLQTRRTVMSMVFQNFALFPNRTILANTEYGLEVQGVDKAIRQEKAEQALALVGLQGYEESYPDQLSGGMKQRVGIARALANDPEILLMDEAFSALDPLIRSDMQDELIELQAKMKKTIIFITHDLDEALKLGDRIMLMKDGQTVQIGTAEEILTNPADEYVRRFVQGVNRSEVLTAADIMVKPWTTVGINQGPRLALKECKKHGIESILVTKEGMKLAGIVFVDDLIAAIRRGEQTLRNIVRENEVVRVEPDYCVMDLIELTLKSSIPVAVVSEGGRLMGVIVKSSVLRALIPERGDESA